MGEMYSASHVGKSSLPVCNIEEDVPKPSITIISGAAPECFGHVVIKMHVDLLLEALCSYSIKKL
jgi:hypothetical protein